MLEWVAMPSFRGSSPPRGRTSISCLPALAGGFLTPCAIWEALNLGYPRNILEGQGQMGHSSQTRQMLGEVPTVFPKEILGGLPSGRVLDPIQGGHSLRRAGSGWTRGQAMESCLGGEGGVGRGIGRKMRKGRKGM